MKYSLRKADPAKSAKKPPEFAAFSDIVSDLLFSRGVKTMKDAEAFLAPDYDLHTHDPF